MAYTEKSSLKLSLTFFCLLFSITLTMGLASNSITKVSADSSVSANASVNVSAACTMSSVVDTAHTATINPDTNQPNIGQTSVTVTCNDPGGYAIYAIGYSGTPSTLGNTDLINTVSSSQTIATGTATSGNNSNWSMKLAPGTASASSKAATIITTPIDYSNYANVPSSYDKVATFASTTDGTGGSSFTTTYQAYISHSQPAGTYDGKVKYALVHPNTAPAPPEPVVTNPGYISYNTNAPTTEVADSMDDQSIADADTSAELWASNFQRSGYGFAGWTDKYDWVLNENDADGNGTGANAGYHIYGPNQTISFTAGQYSGDNPGLSLYAVWVPSAGDLQGYTCPNNTTMPVGTVTALTDTRDNQTYAIAKLKDNKCWMIENLRLDNQYTTGAANIAKAQGYNSSFIGLANPETADFTNSTTANSLYSTDGSTAAPAITGSNPGFRFPRYNNQNTANPASNMTGGNANIYSYGNYYTWIATIADTSDYYTGIHNTTSICPSGWHIPTGNTSGEYDTLNTEQNAGATDTSAGLRAYPANFIYSGYFSYSSTSNRGSLGNYWSSTTYINTNSYYLHFNSSNVYPGTSGTTKCSGRSIRCSL